MLFFLALSCLAAATFGSVVLYQRGERRRLEASGGADPRLLLAAGDAPKRPAPAPSKPPERQSAAEPTLETLQQGDIVDDGEQDYVVTGSVRYREERDTWALHALDGGARQRFLEVRRRGGGLDAAFVDLASGLPSGQLFEGLTFQGRSFSLEVRGDAKTSIDGEVKGRSGGLVAYARYGASGALLLVEDEGAARRAYVGERITPSSLSLMSGEYNRG